MDSSVDSSRAVAAIARIGAVPILLKVLCEMTGMRIAVVARVTDTTWTVCAVREDIPFGLKPGMELPVTTTMCFDSRASRAPVVIEHASADPRYCHHAVPKRYQIESYISVPIISKCGHFGNLSALDPKPAKVMPRIVSMFTDFAALIALQLDRQSLQEKEHRALVDERAAAAVDPPQNPRGYESGLVQHAPNIFRA